VYYTASGIITRVGGRPVHRLREDIQNFILHKSNCYRPLRKPTLR